jgi:hypothetical protein
MSTAGRVELLLVGLAGTMIGLVALSWLRTLATRHGGALMPGNEHVLLGLLVLGAFALGALVAYVVISGIP